MVRPGIFLDRVSVGVKLLILHLTEIRFFLILTILSDMCQTKSFEGNEHSTQRKQVSGVFIANMLPLAKLETRSFRELIHLNKYI